MTGLFSEDVAPAAGLPSEGRRRYRAPAADGGLLLAPSLSDAPALTAQNALLLDRAAVEIAGLPLGEFRQQARSAVATAAREYTAQIAECDPDSLAAASGPWLLSGHQPSLFHPGVWVKNFALGGLAQQLYGTGLNLVVDNDVRTSVEIAVPTGTRAAPRRTGIAWDDPQPQRPWEEAEVLNRARFAGFADEIADALRPWEIDPVIRTLWPAAVRQLARSSLAADCFTAARHQQERRWGCRNLELPLSRVCRLEPFFRFVAAVLADLPRFSAVHNAALLEYRRQNHVASRSHPFPELERDGDWHEAPFWIWSDGAERRERLWVRREPGQLVLAQGDAERLRIPCGLPGDLERATRALAAWSASGGRLRTRALTTTLFARLGLADLFLHGIGGAKYDEVTDRVIERFWGLPAPRYLVATGTLRLLVGHPQAAAEAAELRRAARDFQFNPFRFLPPAALEAAAFREHLAGRPGERGARRLWYADLQRRKQAVREDLAGRRAAAGEDLSRVEEQVLANAVLESREWSFGLYPEARLRGFLAPAFGRPETPRVG